MGTVWVADHLTLETQVAVKFISPEVLEAGNPSVLARFQREARAAARIKSPHIVQTHDLSSYQLCHPVSRRLRCPPAVPREPPWNRLHRYANYHTYICMRTTVELNDALAERVRELMAKRKTTMRVLIEEGLRRVIEEDGKADAEFRMRDASVGVGGDGLVDGVDDLSWETMSRFLYPAR